ncbi:MAG: ankyrin repeat domain-containing protein [Aquihabitans sp.]
MARGGGSRWQRWAATGALTTAIFGALGLLLLVWVARSCSQSFEGIGDVGEIPETGCADSTSAMIQAAAAGDVRTVRSRLAAGTEVNAKDGQGNSALACAGPRGHVEVVALLLDEGATPNTVARDGDTVLSDAVRFCQSDVAALLLEAGANPDQSGRNRSPLDDAVDHGDVDTVRALVDGGADATRLRLVGTRSLQDRESTSDCPAPTDEGRVAALSALLDAGADPSVVLGGAVEVPLAQSGALIDAAFAAGADPDGELAGPVLAVAAATGDTDLVARLLALGADPNRVPAPPTDEDAAVSTTLADPEAQAFSERWDLGWSCPDSNVGGCDVTSGLVSITGADAGAHAGEPTSPNPTLTPREQATAPALLVAAWRGDAAMVRLLLAAGADPQAQTRVGDGALAAAAASGDTETVALLLAAGAGATDPAPAVEASSYAAAMGHDDVAKVLDAAGS